MTTLLQNYRKNVVPALRKEFGIDNIMAVPKIRKVTINVGTGRIHKEDATLERITKEIATITGQHPVSRSAKKSIASFKMREGAPVGISVTLRGQRMYDFIDRLTNIALPRSKDFRGIDPKNFDNNGNLNLGIKESSIFPELNYENVRDIFSLQVTVTTLAGSREKGIALLKSLGFPIKK